MGKIRRKLCKGIFILRDKIYRSCMKSNKLSVYGKAKLIRNKLKEERKLIKAGLLETDDFKDFFGVPEYVDDYVFGILYIMALSDIITFNNETDNKN